MTCKLLNQHLDAYLAGDCAADQAGLLDGHVAACDTCRALVNAQRELLRELAEYARATAPRADDGFYDRAIATAAKDASAAGVAGGNRRRHWVMTGLGGAVAAALVVWMVGGMFLSAPDSGTTVADSSAPASVPGVTMALEQPRTVNLVFSSAEVLVNATMTVVLPPGIEVSGFQGQREISWMTSLKQGKNVLPLTLIATSPQGGELRATLQHEDSDRSFRVQVSVI